MKKLILIVAMILLSTTAFSEGWFFGQDEEETPPQTCPAPEVEKIVIKSCYYRIKGNGGTSAVFLAFQIKCEGIFLVGYVDGMKIVEYNEKLIEINTQTPVDIGTFRDKIEKLWPGMKDIKLKPKE